MPYGIVLGRIRVLYRPVELAVLFCFWALAIRCTTRPGGPLSIIKMPMKIPNLSSVLLHGGAAYRREGTKAVVGVILHLSLVLGAWWCGAGVPRRSVALLLTSAPASRSQD